MPQIRTILSSIVFVVFFSISMFAQTAPPKSVLINTAAFFDEKAGITKLVKAEKDLDALFAADIKALQDKVNKVQTLAAEIEILQKQTVTDATQAAIAAKREQGADLQRNIEFNKTELETKISKSRETMISPINFDIGKAIAEFGKKNGYGAIFDATKMEESGALLFVGDNTDITKDFIAFYNARAANVPVAK